jgi:hypothetical protein
VYVSNSTISGNRAFRGGAIEQGTGTFTLVNSTIVLNNSNQFEAGINGGGTFIISNSIIAANRQIVGTGFVGPESNFNISNGVFKYNVISSLGLNPNPMTCYPLNGVDGNIVGAGGCGVLDINVILIPRSPTTAVRRRHTRCFRRVRQSTRAATHSPSMKTIIRSQPTSAAQDFRASSAVRSISARSNFSRTATPTLCRMSSTIARSFSIPTRQTRTATVPVIPATRTTTATASRMKQTTVRSSRILTSPISTRTASAMPAIRKPDRRAIRNNVKPAAGCDLIFRECLIIRAIVCDSCCLANKSL